MSLEEEAFDKEYKKELFKNIGEFSSKISEYTNLIEKSYSYSNINTKLPNIATNLNNKLVLDIFPKFKESNLYFGSPSSILGEAIIFDLLEKTTIGVSALEDYSSSLKITNSNSLVKISPMRNFLARLRTFMTGDLFSKEQLKNANKYLKEYNEASKSIYNYSMDKDLISSIRAYFKDNNFPKDVVFELIEDDLNPCMKKLNLSNLIPELKNEILNDRNLDKKDFLNDIKTSTNTKIKKVIVKSNNELDKDGLSK